LIKEHNKILGLTKMTECAMRATYLEAVVTLLTFAVITGISGYKSNSMLTYFIVIP